MVVWELQRRLSFGGVGASEAAFIWWCGSFRGGFRLVVWEKQCGLEVEAAVDAAMREAPVCMCVCE